MDVPLSGIISKKHASTGMLLADNSGMLSFSSWTIQTNLIIFGVAALLIAIVGSRLSGVADQLADKTGLGEALVGALLLGGATSLPGIVTSATAAAGGYAELALSNALGGIAAQTAFLAIADLAYRRANLEHAAASMENLLQGTLLIALLTIPLLAASLPQWTWFGIHPATPIMFVVYAYGLRISGRVRKNPMWQAEQTSETQADEPEEGAEHGSLGGLVARMALFALLVGIAGWFVARTGTAIAELSGLSQTLIGGFLTAVSTSLPELVTSVAAVRRGALTLAVGGIIGGNAFDTLFIAVSDIAYREGSIYAAIGSRQIFFVALGMALTVVLIMGMIQRERHGFANIGFESAFIALLYLLSLGAQIGLG
jgi:cation:H+ antiporter